MKTFLFARCYGQRLAALCLFAGLSFSAQAAPAEPTGNGTVTLTGQVTDAATNQPLPYASVGVVGSPAGTVTDALGRFRLAVAPRYAHDSLRVALVGYRPFTATVHDFELRACPAEAPCAVALTPAPQPARPAAPAPLTGRAVRRTLGNADYAQTVPQLFPGNALGTQVGQRIRVKRRAQLEEVAFLVESCTYHHAFYRVNVYPLTADGRPDDQRTLLPEAVYVRLATIKQAERVRVNLREYGLWLEPGQDVAVCLELIHEPGPGQLQLTNTTASGPLFEKYSATGSWTAVSGYGAGIAATVAEVR